MIAVQEIAGVGEFSERTWKDSDETVQLFEVQNQAGEKKAFLVVRPKTLEVRCDRQLGQKLRAEYESVMESRYFGRGGIEIVDCGQLEATEIEDLVRLSYNLTVETTL